MSLYLLSKVIKHKRIMSVLLLLSIILPLLVMCAVATTQYRLLKSNEQRKTEVAAIMERRDAIIARNEAFSHYTRESSGYVEDTGNLAVAPESISGLRGLDRETVEAIQKDVFSKYDPQLELQLWEHLDSLKNPASSPKG